MHAMPLLLGILCVMAIAYRYYSAFLAARVAVLDDSRQTPAFQFNDGQNYHPTNKWVAFGHHFAAISGAGPLIGPVLAAQFGYMPGLLWIVIGVCLAGAVQDFLVMSASLRRGGQSLAQIASTDVGKVAGASAMIAILFIIVIALAGLGKVVVNALGGETVTYPNSKLIAPGDHVVNTLDTERFQDNQGRWTYKIPKGFQLEYAKGQRLTLNEGFELKSKATELKSDPATPGTFTLPPDAIRQSPGSPWGTFTIACTIPIALLVGFYMYKIRPGRVVEASIIGAVLALFATFAGGWIIDRPALASFFDLSAGGITVAMAIYGFIAAVLPVWVLLAPRDYLSSFLKIGTIALLVIGVLIANPKLEAPALNKVFQHGGPTVMGSLFPFLFITIMCGAISGFHALVSSGTTPKMISREGDARTIGYGAMLIEGLVGVVAMIAAAALPPADYYAMNTRLADVPKFHDQIMLVGGGGGVEHIGDYEAWTREPTLRGRTGGAVTLAVGMAHIFDGAARKVSSAGENAMRGLWKYWYHFAIMFEALFILTTIDAGTRIGRFLLQEAGGKLFHPKVGDAKWVPGTIVTTAIIVGAWTYFINANNFAAIWAMFGVANQMLAAVALAIVSAYLVNEGRAKYLWVTLGPMCVVTFTTSSAAFELISRYWNTYHTQSGLPTPADAMGQVSRRTLIVNSVVSLSLTAAMLLSAYVVIAASLKRCVSGGNSRDGKSTSTVAHV